MSKRENLLRYHVHHETPPETSMDVAIEQRNYGRYYLILHNADGQLEIELTPGLLQELRRLWSKIA